MFKISIRRPSPFKDLEHSGNFSSSDYNPDNSNIKNNFAQETIDAENNRKHKKTYKMLIFKPINYIQDRIDNENNVKSKNKKKTDWLDLYWIETIDKWWHGKWSNVLV